MCQFFFFKQKTAYEMRISDWSSDVCSSDLRERLIAQVRDIGRADIARPVGRACRCAAGEILRSRDAALVRGLPGEALPDEGAEPVPVPVQRTAQLEGARDVIISVREIGRAHV